MTSEYFRPEEQSFIKRIEELFANVEKYNYFQLTDFLNLREQFILENIGQRYSETNIFWYGGNNNSERKRAILAPYYYEPEKKDFEVALIEIGYPKKFSQLKHSQILGSLISLGIDRNIFGDIITDGENWQFYVVNKMKDYVFSNLSKIAKLNVRLKEIELDNALLQYDDSDEKSIAVRSFRLDSIISSVYNLSRQHSKDLISNGKVTVNWIKTSKPDFFLTLGDTVSVRGFGRITIEDILSRSDNSKWHLQVNVITK